MLFDHDHSNLFDLRDLHDSLHQPRGHHHKKLTDFIGAADPQNHHALHTLGLLQRHAFDEPDVPEVRDELLVRDEFDKLGWDLPQLFETGGDLLFFGRVRHGASRVASTPFSRLAVCRHPPTATHVTGILCLVFGLLPCR